MNPSKWIGTRCLGERSRKWLGAVIAASIGLAIVEVGLVWFIQQLVRLIFNQQVFTVKLGFLADYEPSFLSLSILLIVLGVLRALAQYLSVHGAAVVHELVNSRLKIALGVSLFFNHKKPFTPASEINSFVVDIFPKTAFFYQSLALAIPQFILAVILLVLLFLTGVGETVLGLTGLLAGGLIVYSLNQRISTAAKARPGQIAQLMRSIIRFSRNWLLVRILKSESIEFAAYQDAITRYTRTCFQVGFYQGIAASVPGLVGIVTIAVVLLTSHQLFPHNQSNLLIFIYLFLRFAQTIALATVHIGNAAANAAQAKMAEGFVSATTPGDLSRAENLLYGVSAFGGLGLRRAIKEGAHLPGLISDRPPRIELNEVSFAYTSEVAVIQKLSIVIDAGTHVGIVGPSGSGKSTLLGLILGLLKPLAGEIRIDGHPPHDYLVSHAIGYVGPEPFIVEGSLLENLSYGSRRTASLKEIDDVLSSVGLAQMVSEHPLGLNLMLNENGDGLSAGQKQRLAIARALLINPKLLILDEPTSNLDAESERLIVDLLRGLKGTVTVLIVSHRPEALTTVNQTIRLI